MYSYLFSAFNISRLKEHCHNTLCGAENN